MIIDFVCINNQLNKVVMGKENKTLKEANIISMSSETKKRISEVANEINGRNLFTEKIELAKKTLEHIKSLPI
jgi:hypothetical protein